MKYVVLDSKFKLEPKLLGSGVCLRAKEQAMPKIVKKPVTKPAAPAGPPRLVIVELLDLTPAADGRTVIARTLTVPETASGQVIEDWRRAKGYRVRVVEQRTPESEKFVYAQHKKFIGASQCQPSSSSEATSVPSGPQTRKGQSGLQSSTEPETNLTARTFSMSKARPSVKSPRPSSRPSSSPKMKGQSPSPRESGHQTEPSVSPSSKAGSTSSTQTSPPKTSRRSGGLSPTSNGKRSNKTSGSGRTPTPESQRPVQGTSRPKPGLTKATAMNSAAKAQPATTPKMPSAQASSQAVAAVKLF